jgi:hypothetical protein
VVVAVGIGQKTGCLDRNARDGIVVRHVLAERDGVFARVRSRRAEAVDIAVAECVGDRRLRMERAETRVVQQDQPDIRRDLTALGDLADQVALASEAAENRPDRP